MLVTLQRVSFAEVCLERPPKLSPTDSSPVLINIHTLIKSLENYSPRKLNVPFPFVVNLGEEYLITKHGIDFSQEAIYIYK